MVGLVLTDFFYFFKKKYFVCNFFNISATKVENKSNLQTVFR